MSRYTDGQPGEWKNGWWLPRWMVTTFVAIGSLGLLLAAFLLGQQWNQRNQASPTLAGFDLPLAAAATATQNESFAIGTGPVDEDVEGLFVLDFLTGELVCSVLNFRTGAFNSVFRANVINDLGIDAEKRPKYLLATGRINFPRGAVQARPSLSVVYVLDTTTGNFAAYGLPWRRELAATGRPQTGPLRLIDVGKARTAAIRE